MAENSYENVVWGTWGPQDAFMGPENPTQVHILAVHCLPSSASIPREDHSFQEDGCAVMAALLWCLEECVIVCSYLQNGSSVQRLCAVLNFKSVNQLCNNKG